LAYSNTDIPKMPPATEIIRRRPRMFFEDGIPTAEYMLERILRDARHVDPTATALSAGSYSAVFANADWLRSRWANFNELFERIVPDGIEPNGCRGEVFLTALGCPVMTVGHGPQYSRRLKISEVSGDIANAAKAAQRGLIWRFDPDSDEIKELLSNR
jgi:hypothetical protein